MAPIGLTRTRILLVDDHPALRAGVAAILSGEGDLEVVGQCGDGLEALRLVAELRPDVVILDLGLPGMSGLEVNRRLAALAAPPAVLILTWQLDESYAAKLAEDGARGLVTKDADPRAIVRAVRDLGSAKGAFPARIRAAPGSDEVRDPWTTLTDREREVAHLTAEGLSSVDTGARLSLSPRTVEVHRGNVYRKLRLSGATELVHFLVRRGILDTR